MLKHTYYSNNYRGILMIRSHVVIATILCLSGAFAFGGQEGKKKCSVARIAEKNRVLLIQEQQYRMMSRYTPTLSEDYKRNPSGKIVFGG